MPGLPARAEQARTYSPGSLRPETVRALYGAELHFSSSRIDVLAGCRFAHFLQYGLRAQEREPAEFDSRFYGTFVHDVLEHVVQQTEREGGFAAVPRSRVPGTGAGAHGAERTDPARDLPGLGPGRAICSGGRLTR